MPNDFVAIDVETADRSRGSICQIGLVAFAGTAIAWEWSTLINPQCDFDGFNVRIHGIGSEEVATAPTLPLVFEELTGRIAGAVMVSHSAFDYEAMRQACGRYALKFADKIWLDSCVVAQTCWPHLSKHDLATVCRELAIPLRHHNALSDARASGTVLATAIAQSGKCLGEWCKLAVCSNRSPTVEEVPRRRYSERIERVGDPNGPLAGHIWVCTGNFNTGEAELARLAAMLGCDVKDRFSKKTTMLVVGTRDPAQFDGQTKSRKQRDAEAAVAEGRKVYIMTEREFLELVRYYQDRATVPTKQPIQSW